MSKSYLLTELGDLVKIGGIGKKFGKCGGKNRILPIGKSKVACPQMKIEGILFEFDEWKT
ncbi:hypothetical protein [Pontibacter sp. G13]|uniref:hypothetical protein n=1 Tax=Pontibacter sp. G13 TaxID=3074898 RepID=UPI00288B3D1B|nr:hypothetical protein [Pontibacter sp. G13]WNJ17989.1 hypothetical protein RJD25_24300 [Pontibacter sp. G13]